MLKVYGAAGLYYLFDLERTSFCVDATRHGNVGRFVNHSCGKTSNCEMQYVPSSFPDVPGRLALLAKRGIQVGEFLSYDYKASSRELVQEGYDMRKLVECKCNDKLCKKWVF
jgi:SET domain-containing protein